MVKTENTGPAPGYQNGGLIQAMRVNSGRQFELDSAKGLAIFFMIAVHCLEVFAKNNIIDRNPYGATVEFLGSFTSATVFMILLGTGIVYSKRSQPGQLLKRGLGLLAAGYLLNLARGFLPMLVKWQMSGSDEWIPYLVIEPFLVDILQFAGLAFILFSLMKKLRLKPAAYVGVLIGFEVLNILLQNYGFYFHDILDYKNPDFYLAAFTGLFWGTSELSSFPFLSWIFYPVAGYLFGEFLIRQEEDRKKRLYLVLLAASAMVFAAAIWLCRYFGIDYGWDTDAAFYHHMVLGNVVFGSCAFLLISLVFFIQRFLPGFVRNTLSRWSKNITEIYFIQWVLIGWTAIAAGYNRWGVLPTVLVTLGVLLISDGLAWLFLKFKTRTG